MRARTLCPYRKRPSQPRRYWNRQISTHSFVAKVMSSETPRQKSLAVPRESTEFSHLALSTHRPRETVVSLERRLITLPPASSPRSVIWSEVRILLPTPRQPGRIRNFLTATHMISTMALPWFRRRPCKLKLKRHIQGCPTIYYITIQPLVTCSLRQTSTSCCNPEVMESILLCAST